MRYIIQYAVAQAAGARLSTYAAILADTPEDAAESFRAAHPDREIIGIREATDADRERCGLGYCTDEEREKIRAGLSMKYNKIANRRAQDEKDLFTYALEEFAAEVDYKKRRASETTQNADGVHVGDLFYASWGYEQTNIDYFQVVGLKGAHTVVLRPVRARSVETDSMVGICRPMRDAFIKFFGEESYTVRTKTEDGDLRINAPGLHGHRLFPASITDMHHWTAYA